ncbi:ABC transporter permease [uncultured Tateyamaria sp.]|uniref:ABC transporter permease n=1 Tax=uncultured Tateyamaria sp. TaxID=455651 RepID=UPI002631857C|nr:ABC transporter permease [uncultured Tateyamaria sp.]
MAKPTAPFAPFEWMIAWRYLRARRAEGGVSTMTWISLIGITLAVFALVATLAVRAGLRADFVDAMLGGNAHIELRYVAVQEDGRAPDTTIPNYSDILPGIEALQGVDDVAPLVRAQVMGSFRGSNAPADVYGISRADLLEYPLVANAEGQQGTLDRFDEGVAVGSQLAAQLRIGIGDRVKLISPDGARTALGITPRISAYEVVYIFSTGQPFMDQSRMYLPLEEAQSFFNREGVVDQIDLRLAEPENLTPVVDALREVAGDRAYSWTWQDRFGGMLRALELQNNAIFIVLAIVVLIAALNIVSGLIMLVKNKGRDIGILRTMGLSQGSILRIFFLCGAWVGTVGTVLGIALGALFSANIEHVYRLVNMLTGNGVTDLEGRGFIFPSAVLSAGDVLSAAVLSLTLSWLVTLFPARRAARMNPVEALRYE